MKRLATAPDSTIDYSDIPPLTKAQLRRMRPGREVFRFVGKTSPEKQITLRVDAEVLDWLKSLGPANYQSKLNSALRTAMSESRNERQKKKHSA